MLSALIILALIGLVVGAVLKLSGRSTHVLGGGASNGGAFVLPAGAKIVGTDTQPGRLILHVTSPQGDEIDIVSTEDGHLIAQVKAAAPGRAHAAMTVLELPATLRAQIGREAQMALPRECCGLLEGMRGADGRVTVMAVHRARNLSRDADCFEIDPADQFRALHAARERRHAIVGCYHSHPNGVAEPSARDAEGAGEEGFVWIIAAAGAGDEPVLRAFVFQAGAFSPAEIAV